MRRTTSWANVDESMVMSESVIVFVLRRVRGEGGPGCVIGPHPPIYWTNPPIFWIKYVCVEYYSLSSLSAQLFSLQHPNQKLQDLLHPEYSRLMMPYHLAPLSLHAHIYFQNSLHPHSIPFH
jgi:hypothetical protein